MTETRSHGLFPREGFHSILDPATSANGLTTTPETSFIAGAPRKPEAFGVPLVYKAVCIENRTMETLKKVEGLYPGVGRSRRATFFPGGLGDADAKWWAKSKKAVKAAERKKRSEMRWRQNGDAVPKQRNLSVDGRKRGSGPNGSINDQSLLENGTHKTKLANNENIGPSCVHLIHHF